MKPKNRSFLTLCPRTERGKLKKASQPKKPRNQKGVKKAVSKKKPPQPKKRLSEANQKLAKPKVRVPRPGQKATPSATGEANFADISKLVGMTVKAKVIKAEYLSEFDTVVWETVLPDFNNTPYLMQWPAEHFGHAMGVCKPGVRIPDNLLYEFLDNLMDRQKEFNLVVKPQVEKATQQNIHTPDLGAVNQQMTQYSQDLPES